MTALEKGITRNGTGYSGKTWNILGQVYFPKAVTDSTFAFETNSDPGQFVPVHIHPTQDEFILVQDGMLDLKLDGLWVRANAGDLVRLPRGIPHGYFNKSDQPARALFWVSPTQRLEALFNQLHNLTDVAEIVRISAEHEVNFLPPEANDWLGKRAPPNSKIALNIKLSLSINRGPVSIGRSDDTEVRRASSRAHENQGWPLRL